MKIAVLFPVDSPAMAWNLGRGWIRTLNRMGIETLAVDMPTAKEANPKILEAVKKRLPKIGELRECDGVIVSGPEHIGPWIEEVYERYEWRNLNVPTAAWLHESCERDDYTIDFDAIKWIGRDWFFPAIQDAEKHDQPMFAQGHSHWLPIGVDTELFRPAEVEVEQEFPVGFIGMLYPKRIAFLKALSTHEIPQVRLGRVEIHDMHGFQFEESTRRYIQNLHQIKVFFNLPALSRLMIGKVTEVLACGGFLLTPLLPSEGGVNRNMQVFESEKHLIYYRASNLTYLAQLLREWSSPEKESERRLIASLGCGEAQKNHSLEDRMETILSKMGLNVGAARAAGG